jgi:transglutaminase-like putative cysteine protease
MKAQTQLKICAYVLSLLGLWSVTLTEYFSYVWPASATIVFCISWFFNDLPGQNKVYRSLWIIFGVGILLFFPVDIVLSGNLLLPAVHLSVFVQAYLLFNLKSLRIYRRVFAVSFAQLLASTLLTNDIMFAVLLFFYCGTVMYGIMLLHLLKSKQDRSPTEFAFPVGQEVPHGLLFSSLSWTVLLVPLTLAFFFAGPRLQYRIGLGSNEAEVLNRVTLEKTRTGFSETVTLGTFGQVQEDPTLALRVELVDNSEALGRIEHWRGGASNIYTGTAWTSSRDYFAYYNGKTWVMSNKNSGIVFPRRNDLFITDDRYANHRTAQELDADPRLVKQVCYLEIPYSDRIFGADRIKALQGPFKYGIEQDFNRSFTIRNRQALPEFISYTVYSEINEPSASQLRQISFGEFEQLAENEEYGAYVRTHFLQLPDDLDPRIQQLALEITRNAATPYDKVSAIKAFLENEYKYRLDSGGPAADDPLANFLFVRREGHCEYFASAMVVMVRIIGIPARVANGFGSGEWNEASQFYEVRQRDAHAWAEIYFPRYGWLSFDPSPREPAEEYFRSRRSPLVSMLSRKLLTLKLGWRKYFVGYSQTQRTSLFSRMKSLFFHDGPGALVALSRRVITAIAGLLSARPLLLVLGAALVAAVFAACKKYLFSPVLPWPIRLIRRRRARTAFYEKMLRLLEKRRIVKPPQTTSLEFLQQPAVQEHPMAAEIESLISMYYRVRFGDKSLTREEVAAITDILKRLQKSRA